MTISNRFGVPGLSKIIFATAILAMIPGSRTVAQGEADEAVPDDTCIIQFDLPEGATVIASGKDYGAKKQLTYQNLTLGEYYPTKIGIRFADGTVDDHSILMEPGRRVRLIKSPRRTDQPELVVQSDQGYASTVAFSPDGRYLLTCGIGIVLWDAATGIRIRSYAACEGGHGAVFSPDGRKIAGIGYDVMSLGTTVVLVWDVATGNIIRKLRADEGMTRCISFSADGRQILAGTDKGKAIIWDIASGEVAGALWGHSQFVSGIAVSPNGQYAATVSHDVAAVWNLATRKKLRTFQIFSAKTPVFGSKSETLLIQGFKEVAQWDVSSGERLHTFPVGDDEQSVISIALSPDGHSALVASGDYRSGKNTVTMWDVKTGKRRLQFEVPGSSLFPVAFSPDNRCFLTGSLKGAAILWDAVKGERVRTFGGRYQTIQDLAMSPNGHRLVVGGGVTLWEKGGTLFAWDLAAGELTHIFPGPMDPVWTVAFSHDGQKLVSGGGTLGASTSGSSVPRESGEALVWEFTTNEKLHAFNSLKGRVVSAEFSPDGRRLLTGISPIHGAAAEVTFWDVVTGERRQSIQPDGPEIWAAGFCPDGRYVITGDGQRLGAARLVLWDARSLAQVRVFPVDGSPILFCDFHPDGEHLLVTYWSSTKPSSTTGATPLRSHPRAEIRRLSDGRQLHSFSSELSARAIYSPDGRQVLCTYNVQGPKLWDATSGDRLQVFHRKPATVTIAVFSPDGRRILGVEQHSNAVRLWDVATAQELAALYSFDGGKDWLVVTPEGLFDGSEGGRKRVSYRKGLEVQVAPDNDLYRNSYRAGLLAEIWRGERPMPNSH